MGAYLRALRRLRREERDTPGGICAECLREAVYVSRQLLPFRRTEDRFGTIVYWAPCPKHDSPPAQVWDFTPPVPGDPPGTAKYLYVLVV